MCNNPWFKKIYNKWQMLPCGDCMGCRVDSLLLWQARCNTEYIKYRSAFVTFTYDDLHLPYNSGALLPTLRKLDFHKYMDNLKHKVKKLPFLGQGCTKNYSFFGNGEYGDSFARSHYHVLFFGLDYADCRKLFIDTWKNGSIKCLPVLSGGIRYVVDYMTKNLSGEMAEAEYDATLRERPFKSCSRGLGAEFFFAHREEINDTGFIKMGSRSVPIPSYYKNILTFVNEDSLAVRDKVRLDSYKQIMRTAREFGFTDYDAYVKYQRKSNELSLYKRFQSKGIPVVPSYNDYESLGDGHVPSRIQHKLNYA